MRFADQTRQLQHVAARLRVAARRRNRRAERDEHARPVADRVAHHLGELAGERTLQLLDALPGQDVIFEHEVVRDADRNDDEAGLVGGQRRVNQPGLRRLQLAAVAAAAFRIQKEIVLLQDLGDVRLERDQIRGILGVAPDRNRAGDVLVDQAERSAEQIDARRDERRPHAGVVEHDRLDQIVEMALVVRRVDDAMVARRRERIVLMFGNLLVFPKNRVERMLQRPVHPVALSRAKLAEVGVDAFSRARFVLLAVSAAQILDDFLTSENCLRDLVEHGNLGGDYSILPTASANSRVVAVPPRSRVRTPAVSTVSSAFITAVRRRCFIDVMQHQHSGEEQRGRVRDALAGDVGRAAVHRFEHGAREAQVRGAYDTQSADEARAEIRHDVAVQVRQHQHVEPLGREDELHARRVDDALVVGDLGILARDGPDAVEKQPVAHLHDVGLVDRGHALAPVPARVLERESSDSRRRLLGDDLQALDDAGNDLVFQPGVEILGVLADDDEVDVAETRRHARQVPHGAKIRVEVEPLPKTDVHAREAFPHRSRDRTLERDRVAPDRLEKLRRKRRAALLDGNDAGVLTFPFDRDLGSGEDPNDCISDFRTDAIAWDESDLCEPIPSL